MELHCVRRTFRWQICLVVAVLWMAIIPAAFAGEFNIYGLANDFTWKEFGDDGSLLLKESGTLGGIGFTYWHERDNHLTLQPTAEISGGTVDYNGQACDAFGNCVSAVSQVDYIAFRVEGELGYRFHEARGLFIEPFGGLGLRVWTRDIRDGTAADGSLTVGYTEDWESLYTRVGLRGGVDLNEENQLFAEAGVRYPVYTENTAYLSGIGSTDVTMNPGGELSFFAEAGVKIDRFKGSLFYDSMRFSKSPIEANAQFVYWQPKSSADFVGIKAGVVF